ncbi:MAG: hypothetical protein JST12_02905 [Armatimonadetes bacterium]|nr:hypothetical protein [Armatimonadota bacterium]MBS1700584.1 hypothetical protein [Armatimonadota bacterium]MBS1728931.1 hypothetical protein [Armatimonadota bacterium]
MRKIASTLFLSIAFAIAVMAMPGKAQTSTHNGPVMLADSEGHGGGRADSEGHGGGTGHHRVDQTTVYSA